MVKMALLVVVTSALLLGCANKIVVTFPDYDEVMVGDIKFRSNGGAKWTTVGQLSGLGCEGIATINGKKILATCEYGMSISGKWHLTGLAKGHGRGQCGDGTWFEFTFGHSESEASALVAQALLKSSTKPSLYSHISSEHKHTPDND
ncbi:hypothetical protein N9H39_07745 [Gammaproteobacteria bacterium]|nr:hypothetical protein [Gammaproteobacteria bacterium]